VLSRRGAVMPHEQWEQHQRVKSSHSTQIKRLFIHLPFIVRLGFELGHGGTETHQCIERGRELLPAGEYFHGIAVQAK
jgi:hypothetical protein